MTKKQRNVLIDGLCLSPIFAWLAIYSYPLFFESLSHNYREIQTYNLDSMVMLRAVEDALRARWFEFDFGDYGHFYFNLAIATAYVCSHIVRLTEWGLVFILRLFALLGGCFSIAITYAFAKRYLGRREAVFAVAVMAFSPRFIEFSNEVKPDTWQVFFITLSLYFLARAFEGAQPAGRRQARFGFVMAACSAAGAAFGTKYQGILLIPLLAPALWMIPVGAISDRFFALSQRLFMTIAILLGTGLIVLGVEEYPLRVMTFLGSESGDTNVTGAQYWLIEAGRVICLAGGAVCFVTVAAYITGFEFGRWRPILAKGLIALCGALTFCATFALTSPWLLYQLQFLPKIYFRSHYANEGDWYGFHWLNMLFGIGGAYPEYFINYAIGALGVAGGVLTLAALARRDFRATTLPFLFVLGFILLFLTLLIARINFVTTLYLLPVVPSLVLLAALALHEIFRILPRWFDRKGAAWAALALTGLLIASQVWQGGSQLLQYPMLVTTLTPPNRMLGTWLERCVPSDTRILAAAYSYIPPHIANMSVNWGPDYRNLANEKPDMVTINLDEVASAAKSAAIPGHVPSGIDRFYDAILHSGTWRAGPTFPPFGVYVKTAGAAISPACR